MSNPFAYAQLHTQNPNAAKDFYRRLLDWKMTDVATPLGAYTDIEIGEGIAAGLVRSANDNVSSHWLPYIRVADLVASTSKAKELGARALREMVSVPDNQGRYSVFSDPTGALFGLWEKGHG